VTDQFAGKVAIVTGAGRGVGRAYARALAARGAQVVINDLSPDSGESPASVAAQEITRGGGVAIPNHEDISDFEAAGRLVAHAKDTFGRLDIVIANAGIIRPGLLHTLDPHDWEATIAVHANGTFNCIQQSSEALIGGGGGSIITTGDITTDLLFPKNGAYRAAKAAVAVATLYAAEELRPYNINVNSVMPGATATRMVDTYQNSLGGELDAFTARVNDRRDKSPSEAPPAAPESVPPLGLYLCLPEARSTTGRLFQINRGQIRMITSSTVSRALRTEAESWTVEDLAKRVPEFLADSTETA
jgi:NAD(P)-dependent dehydrogenase (short-subunit alcohol dehydrogenase family)